ncbi:MAG: acyl-CoA dehydrogenase family protein [Dehalococcoidia bacterium]
MDFRFSPQEGAFRQEVRTFLDRELPPDWDADPYELTNDDQEWAFATAFLKKVGQRGWIAPHWPKEYGGAGLSVMEQLIYNEEMAYRRAPLVNVIGVRMLGPTLIVYGSEAQKRQHLPGIASSEVIWCQGYSEPGSGSDLASLQTRAVRDGDDYVINGQKIWTSYAHRAQWNFLLARTDPDAPKHRGISFFLLDMKTPGITIQPLVNMAGLHGFNQVFYDNVRIPKENLVGEENRGWYIGASLLDFERSNIAGAALARRDFEHLVQFCRQTKTNGRTLLEDPLVRHKLAEMAIEIEIGRFISYRVASIQARGQIPNMEASVAKLYHSELSQRLANTGLQIMGLYGQLRPESGRWARLQGRFAMSYMITVSNTIAAGTSEIQRNIIAARGLGLPRA